MELRQFLQMRKGWRSERKDKQMAKQERIVVQRKPYEAVNTVAASGGHVAAALQFCFFQ